MTNPGSLLSKLEISGDLYRKIPGSQKKAMSAARPSRAALKSSYASLGGHQAIFGRLGMR